VIYPDASFLLPMYTPEPQTLHVNRYLAEAAPFLFFTPFHRLEFRTAVRVRVFRKGLTPFQLLVDGILQHTPLLWADALREAERLGEAHLTETGVRSGDLFHVASAVVLGAREFVTFDQRQTTLARRAGLKVKTWKAAK
jgi:predicted nucleic acid-binding protein